MTNLKTYSETALDDLDAQQDDRTPSGRAVMAAVRAEFNRRTSFADAVRANPWPLPVHPSVA